MLKCVEIKSVSKAIVSRENLVGKALNCCNDEVNGKRNASYIINTLGNNGFSALHVKGVITEGTATERQVKAIVRMIHGRHYRKEILTDFIRFLDYPNDFNTAIPMKKAKIWVNITREEEKPIFTAEELADMQESLKNF